MAKADSKHPIETPPHHVAARLPPLGSTTAGGMGALLAMLLGAALFSLGVVSGLRDDPMPMPLTIALCLAGGLEAVLGWFTLRRVRAAWAFATSIAGTVAVAFLFSAPKIRDAVEVDLGVALLPAMVGAVACVLLAYAAPDVK